MPEPGWYEEDPSAEGGWRRVSRAEASEWGGDLGYAPDDRRLVRYATAGGRLVAWTPWRGNLTLPNGQVLPSRAVTAVIPASR